MTRRKPTKREAELQAIITRLELSACAAVWMLRNKQPFTPDTWLCVSGPRVSRILVHTNADGFPSSAWHDSELDGPERNKILLFCGAAKRDECQAAIDAVFRVGARMERQTECHCRRAPMGSTVCSECEHDLSCPVHMAHRSTPDPESA